MSYPLGCRGHGKCARPKVAAFGSPTVSHAAIDHAQFGPGRADLVDDGVAGARRRTSPAGRFRLLARRRSLDRPGHSLRGCKQLRRAADRRLCRRMRGEACGRASTAKRATGTGGAKVIVEDVGLLPARGRKTATKLRPSGATILLSGNRTCSGWAISPTIPSIPPAPRSILRWSISEPTIQRSLIPPRPMLTAPRLRPPVRPKEA